MNKQDESRSIVLITFVPCLRFNDVMNRRYNKSPKNSRRTNCFTYDRPNLGITIDEDTGLSSEPKPSLGNLPHVHVQSVSSEVDFHYLN